MFQIQNKQICNKIKTNCFVIFLIIFIIICLILQSLTSPNSFNTFANDWKNQIKSTSTELINNQTFEHSISTPITSEKKIQTKFILTSNLFQQQQQQQQQQQTTTKSPIKSTVIQHIHQTWKTHILPTRFSKWSSSWLACYPTWNFTLWTDKDNRNLVKQHYPQMLPFYDKFDENIFRVDFIRYLYLHHYGGLYVDLDTECLRPFEHLLENYTIVFGAMDGQFGTKVKEGHTQNSFMYSRPKHPFWMELIKQIMSINKEVSVGEWTGPYKLARVINFYRAKYDKEWKIYKPKYFNPFSWIKYKPKPCKPLNKMNDKELKECHDYHLARGSFVLQYHTKTWSKEGKIL